MESLQRDFFASFPEGGRLSEPHMQKEGNDGFSQCRFPYQTNGSCQRKEMIICHRKKEDIFCCAFLTGRPIYDMLRQIDKVR